MRDELKLEQVSNWSICKKKNDKEKRARNKKSEEKKAFKMSRNVRISLRN